ncbi:uncharacterized protein PGTG_07788 [Puccinia graminis f. sp. tritici CRL 75-36-700-3]|uniref:CxC1-like cysteine cluster associated with KDZ transposases domain-containing protein n=1 Tax=Puccinia graminis f. sp. tritici (strain CRL 75-36-700-3 / race SCCL) TaxID=418459 RepID=E3KBS6_PUCGT|nr:uncharacterized protein PGTG_07788 [Puccinia graminis f. sp. tritici CRL 75-36-700-3]EFP81539.1 hypothetical protein PGTG_07788 [Puccinia graminis f. sp. tritici CRL 75-36-700-3]
MARNAHGRNRHNTTADFLITGTSRRSRTQAAQIRNQARELEEHRAFLEEVSIAQQLGIVDASYAQQFAGPPHEDDEQERSQFEPLIGSYVGEDFENDVEQLPCAAHAAYHRARRYAEGRERMSQRWSELEEQVAAAFLICQKATKNWTSLPGTYTLPPNTCTCDPINVQERSMDLFDIISSSPDVPRTAFSIRLLQFHELLWQTAVVSTSSFVQALSAFLEMRSDTPLYARGGNYRKRNLRVPLSHSIDMFSRIRLIQQKILIEGLQLSQNDQWANQCPRCFGPNQHEVKSHPKEPDIIIALDGNFQQRHYAYASKDNPPESHYPRSFVKPSKITNVADTLTATDASAVGIDPPCADVHKAANDARGETTWEKCDDNGLFASACRHDIPLMFANIYKTGEKLYYPIALVRNLLADFPQHKVGILYDIGCHLERHVRRRGLLSDRLPDLIFGTSVFHAYVHEWSCQVKYNPRLNPWWGLSDGECLERLWAFLSPLISTLRVSTRLHRLTSIQHRADYYTKELNEKAAYWLLQKLEHANEVISSSRQELAELYQRPNNYNPGSNYNSHFLEQQWSDEQAYHLHTSRTSEKQQLELGRLLCLEEELNKAWQLMGDAMTPEQALTQANTCVSVQRQLQAQRNIVGTTGLADNLTQIQQDKLAMVWYTKTELRKSFLALIEEKEPLLRVCRPGESSTLGTRGQQKLIEALRKQAGSLRENLDNYNRLTHEFIASNPDRPAPPIISYPNLLELQPDDMFWNDGLFTNASEPWAVDPLTQRGIRRLACLQRGLEEVRRLGWEVRRTMRWATERHKKLAKLMRLLVRVPDNGSSIPEELERLVGHSHLTNTMVMANRLHAAGVIVHSSLIQILSLQLEWHIKLPKVFVKTTSQLEDEPLLRDWNSQIDRIKQAIAYGLISGIPGDFSEALIVTLTGDLPNPRESRPVLNQPDLSANLPDQPNHADSLLNQEQPLHFNQPNPPNVAEELPNIHQPLPVMDEAEGDEIDEEEAYHADMENILSETMRADLEQDTGVEV